ncbi:M81 family metallopeptidase [Candidatus Poribacteria bacterium]|jgi:microcystin degradation protein MlrC|nr:M81 family metallopeptidase [Candidatus Poribacteria bacterium]MBT5714683.1 M81 family metallopeptidase [Candidatus Poribacteria bacterium]MBT7804092.1 M81 family metallopeptidase [Candidatus Poribacteria bacterium]
MPYRFVSAQFGHETNTFVAAPTRLDDFRLAAPDEQFGSPASIVAARRGTRTIHGGFIDAAATHGVSLTPLLATFAQPGGVVEAAAYRHIMALLLDRLRGSGACAAVLLDLHGAMVADDLEDAEGDVIAAVRALVGADTPIIVTLDSHANVTGAMAEAADVIVGFDEYPHIDMYERGVEAVDIAVAIAAGEVVPTLAFQQVPLLTMPPMQYTKRDPMLSLLRRAWDIEAEPGVVNATLSVGFPYADIRDAGVSVSVTTDGDAPLAAGKARELAQAFWDARDEFDVNLTPVSDVIDHVQQHATGLVVLADGSDNPGGGGPADGTVILRELVARDVQGATVAAIADPQSARAAASAGVGATVTLDVGGKTDDRHGAPLRVTGYVRLVSDGRFEMQGPMGRGSVENYGVTVVLVVGGVEIVLTERRRQPYDAELLRSVGIEPSRRRLIALKSAVHFRQTYHDIAHRIFDADTPGVHRPKFDAYKYANLRPGVYPVSPVVPDPGFSSPEPA